MKYKIECYYNKKMFINDIVYRVYNPVQALSKSLMASKHTIPPYFECAVMNDNGDIWIMFVEHKNNKIKVREDVKHVVGNREISYIFNSKTKNISEVI